MSDAKLLGIRSDLVDLVWPAVEPLIERACGRSHGTYEARDIYDACRSQDMQLWTVWREKELAAIAVTQIKIYPRMKVCAVNFVAGEGRDDWLHFNEVIAEWAKARGCSHFEGYMRKGWERVLGDDWERCWLTMRKEL